MSIICLFHYIQSPISSSLQAMGYANDSMKGTLFGMILRSLVLIIGCSIHIAMWGLVFATGVNILFVTFYYYGKVCMHLKKNH